MPGRYAPIPAHFVAVAKLSLETRKIIFDANGGYLVKETDKTPRVAICVDELLKTKNKIYEAVPYGTPEGYSDTPEREGYEFKGWSTDRKADANSLINNYIQDGKQLIKTEMATLYGNGHHLTMRSFTTQNLLL